MQLVGLPTNPGLHLYHRLVPQVKIIRSTNEYISLSACPNFLNGVSENLFYCPTLWSRHRRQIIYNIAHVLVQPLTQLSAAFRRNHVTWCLIASIFFYSSSDFKIHLITTFANIVTILRGGKSA